MDDLIAYAFIALVSFLAGLWIGRHPERVRQAEARIVAKIHERTAPHLPPSTDSSKQPPAAP